MSRESNFQGSKCSFMRSASSFHFFWIWKFLWTGGDLSREATKLGVLFLKWRHLSFVCCTLTVDLTMVVMELFHLNNDMLRFFFFFRGDELPGIKHLLIF